MKNILKMPGFWVSIMVVAGLAYEFSTYSPTFNGTAEGVYTYHGFDSFGISIHKLNGEYELSDSTISYNPGTEITLTYEATDEKGPLSIKVIDSSGNVIKQSVIEGHKTGTLSWAQGDAIDSYDIVLVGNNTTMKADFKYGNE